MRIADSRFELLALVILLLAAASCDRGEPKQPDWQRASELVAEEQRRTAATTRDIPQLIRMIDGGRPDEQARAAAALRGIGPSAAPAVPHLIRLLDKPYGGTPGDAAYALADIGEPAVPALIEALASPNKAVRDWVAEPLTRIGLPAERPLIAALGDSRREVRLGAARILGHLHECTAASARGLESALADPDEEVRRTAADSLRSVQSHLAWMANQRRTTR